jgi:drug/metabolite transporter (DMT)-like permease
MSEPSAPSHIGRPSLGIALMIAAVFLFALSDVLTKDLSTRFPVPFVQAVRYGVSLVLVVILLAPRMRRRLWTTGRPVAAILRAGLLVLASLTLGFALRLMPVGETIALIFLAPFLVMLLSAPVLGETVRRAQWAGATIGFIGILLVVRPGSGLNPVGVAFGLLNALIATAFILSTRILTRTERAETLLFYVCLVGTGAFCVMALPFWPDTVPAPIDLGAMALLGAFSMAGHYLFSLAFREAPPALLGPVNYVHVVFAALLGWIFYSHVPEAITLFGMVLVVAGGAVAALWDRWRDSGFDARA